MSNIRLARHIVKDEAGAVLVETTVLIPILIIFMLGAVDFLFAFYAWNAASKAVEVGARLAAVSNPVASGLNNLSVQVVSLGLAGAGDPMPPFTVTCDGNASTCTCTGQACNGNFNFDPVAMNTIVYGRNALTGRQACGNVTSNYYAGMCNMFGSINNIKYVKIVYMHSDLGFAGRPGGPVPTVVVSLQNLQFQFFFLGALPGVNTLINFRPFATTATGEVLSSAAQAP